MKIFRSLYLVLSFLVLLFWSMLSLQAQEGPSANSAKQISRPETSGFRSSPCDTIRIYHFVIDQEIAPSAVRITRKALKEAAAGSYQLLILELNTFGGTLKEADEIRSLLLQSSIPIYAYINHNAASAGALIALSCHRIYMNPAATIGSATVVNQNGEVQPDKYQSYMRALMRSTASLRGRNADIAQAMVDPKVYIHGLIDSTHVLAFTAQEALDHLYCEGIYPSLHHFTLSLKQEAPSSVFLLHHQNLNATDKMIHLLISPWLSAILIMLIVGGIYFEMQSPGIGFALAVALVAALLYFAPLYIEGLAAHWEIALFLLGVILLALEIFAFPGFGICGISGIALICGSLTLSLLDNQGLQFRFISPLRLLEALTVVILSLVVTIPLCFWGSKRLFTRKFSGRTLSLSTEQNREEGYISVDLAQMQPHVGKMAQAATVLRPGGKIQIDGLFFDASSESGFIEKGEQVWIVRFENAQFFVRKNHE